MSKKHLTFALARGRQFFQKVKLKKLAWGQVLKKVGTVPARARAVPGSEFKP